MPDKVTCEIYLAMNEDGGWIVTSDESEALERLSEDEGGWQARVIKLTVKMAPPKAIVVGIDIPDDAGECTKVEVSASQEA